MAITSHQFCALLFAERQSVVGLVPCSERRTVDADDTILDKCLRSNQLIVAGIVQDVNDTCLASDRCYKETKLSRNSVNLSITLYHISEINRN